MVSLHPSSQQSHAKSTPRKSKTTSFQRTSKNLAEKSAQRRRKEQSKKLTRQHHKNATLCIGNGQRNSPNRIMRRMQLDHQQQNRCSHRTRNKHPIRSSRNERCQLPTRILHKHVQRNTFLVEPQHTKQPQPFLFQQSRTTLDGRAEDPPPHASADPDTKQRDDSQRSKSIKKKSMHLQISTT